MESDRILEFFQIIKALSSNPEYYRVEIEDAIEKVKRAYNKQIPMKPIMLEDTYERYSDEYYHCPVCLYTFDSEDSKRYKFCPMCGQRIED